MTPRRTVVGIAILALLAAGACLARVLIGRSEAGVVTFSWPEPEIATFRYTALVVGLVVGSSLAVSGTLLQALLRNPLASPFILGVSSGAGLGVMTAKYAAHVRGHPLNLPGGDLLPALAGGTLALLMVYLLGRRRGPTGGLLDPVSLILVGVIISTICGALIMFLQHLAPGGLHTDLLMWMMGQIREMVAPAVLWSNTLIVIAAIIVATLLGRAMDAATLGDDEARSVGVSLPRLRVALFAVAGLLAACAVALAGPIGFVGLVAPHAARLLIGPQHTTLVIAAALCGVIFVVGADVGTRAVEFGAGRLPIGVVTALVGGPAFLWLLCSGRGQV